MRACGHAPGAFSRSPGLLREVVLLRENVFFVRSTVGGLAAWSLDCEDMHAWVMCTGYELE
eukprot:1160862-Pelagomonas_calceolata.AAC.4